MTFARNLDARYLCSTVEPSAHNALHTVHNPDNAGNTMQVCRMAQLTDSKTYLPSRS